MRKGGTRNSVCPSAKAQWLSRQKGPSSLWPDLVGRRRIVRRPPAPRAKAKAKAKSKTLENPGNNGTVPLQTTLMTSNRKALKSSFCAGSGGSRWVSILVPSNVCKTTVTKRIRSPCTHTGEIDSEKSIRLFWHLFTPVRNAVELLGPLSAKKFQSTHFLWS